MKDIISKMNVIYGMSVDRRIFYGAMEALDLTILNITLITDEELNNVKKIVMCTLFIVNLLTILVFAEFYDAATITNRKGAEFYSDVASHSIIQTIPYNAKIETIDTSFSQFEGLENYVGCFYNNRYGFVLTENISIAKQIQAKSEKMNVAQTTETKNTAGTTDNMSVSTSRINDNYDKVGYAIYILLIIIIVAWLCSKIITAFVKKVKSQENEKSRLGKVSKKDITTTSSCEDPYASIIGNVANKSNDSKNEKQEVSESKLEVPWFTLGVLASKAMDEQANKKRQERELIKTQQKILEELKKKK